MTTTLLERQLSASIDAAKQKREDVEAAKRRVIEAARLFAGASHDDERGRREHLLRFAVTQLNALERDA